jgi:hypothetical protein
MRSWLASIVLIGAATGTAAYLWYPVHVPTNCAKRGSLRSVDDGPKTTIEFINAGTTPVRLVSIGTEGVEALYDTIQPKKKIVYQSNPTHIWMMRDMNGDCLGLFRGDSRRAVVTPAE